MTQDRFEVKTSKDTQDEVATMTESKTSEGEATQRKVEPMNLNNAEQERDDKKSGKS